AERLAGGAGAIAAQNAVIAARHDLDTRQKTATPKVEILYTALAEGKWPQILAAAEAVLVAVPEHPAARQARAKAWQQIAAIGPAGAAQWPSPGNRTAQAATLMGLNPEPENPTAGPSRPIRGEARPVSSPPAPRAGTEAEGIVWLTASGDGPASPPGIRPVPARNPAPGPIRGGRPQGPIPALGRCRGRLSGLPG